MAIVIALLALTLLMVAAYRGYSVILFAPIAALLAVLFTEPAAVPSIFTGLFMEKMVGFLKNYFAVFLLGAVFGKLIELSGFSQSIAAAVVRLVGEKRAMLSIVLIGALLTYGGVSLFVAVFAVYPFASEIFKRTNIPKRLIPATIGLGVFTFTMDSLPGTPQIQNIIPTTYFKTDTWAAPILGSIGAVFIFVTGLIYLEWRRRKAVAAGEGYGEGHLNEPEPIDTSHLVHPLIALLPLVVVGVSNLVYTRLIVKAYGATVETQLAGMAHPVTVDLKSVSATWAVMGALVTGIVLVLVLAYKQVIPRVAEGTKTAVAGALLASMNTASEYGFGAVIAALPGFIAIKYALGSIPNPLINEAVTVTTLAGITGSASGGMSIALAAMSDQFIAAAHAANIPLEVLHRIAAMASGGMDTLPHNGAVITLLAVTGLTHRQSYPDIFAITVLRTVRVFVVIAIYFMTGWV